MFLRKLFTRSIFLLCFCILVIVALIVRGIKYKKISTSKPKLIFAGAPISGLLSTAAALNNSGYTVLTIANNRNFIGEDKRFDVVMCPRPSDLMGSRTLLFAMRHISLFWKVARQYDILHGYFNGGMFGTSPLARHEYWLWKLAGGKLVLMPYGSDAFVYSELPDKTWANTIVETYPHTPREDEAIKARLVKFCKLSDAVVGCLVHHINLPKVTINPLLWYPAEDLGEAPLPTLSGTIRMKHAPNHRLIKGTNLLIAAVEKLQKEGIDIDLEIIENRSRTSVIEALKSADVVVDQIHAGYALHALEGMSLGKITVTGIDLSDLVYDPHKDILVTSPLVFTSAESLLNDLRLIIDNRHNWHTQSIATKEYLRRHHSPEVMARMFTSLYKTLI